MTRQQFDQADQASREFIDNGMKSFAAFANGLQAIGAETADYSRHAVESSSSATQEVIAAGSLDKALEMQAAYMRTACEEFVAQTSRMNELYAGLARDVFRPFQAADAGAK